MKTKKSKRSVDLADFVLEEIFLDSPDFTSRVYVATKNLSAYDISEAIEEYVSANHLLPEDYDPQILFLPDDSIYKKWFFIK